MDNLKFATEYVQAEGEFKEVFGQVLCVYARTREDIKYQCVICDTNAIQYEKPFLLPDMVNETIIKHIASEIPDYTYDIHKDQIIINILVLPNKGLSLRLSKDLSSMPNESARISRVEALITRLTLNEVIEQHTIKMLPTDNEFKKLPAFRYFEACRQIENYFKPHPKLHLGEYNKLLYTFYQSNYPHYEQKTKQAKAIHTRCTTLQEINDAISNYDNSHLSVIRGPDDTATVKINPEARQITPAMVQYIHKYVIGFMLLNHQLLFGRDLTLEIHGATYLTINICRSTRPMFRYIPTGNEVLGLAFPTLTTMTINDWHFDFRP